MRGSQFGVGRRWAVLAVPVAVPISMWAIFSTLDRRMSSRAAYNIGFFVYWVVWCGLFPIWVLGWRRCVLLFTAGGRASRTEIAGLLLPAVGGAATQLIPNRRDIDPAVAAVMLASAAVNAPLEELLWRGLFLEMFPEDVVRGAVWPLAGFSLWHLAPQVILPSKMGRFGFLAGAAAVGAASGATVWRRRGLRPVLFSHFATDAMGVTAARFRMGRTSRR
jgi:hypothetical protein